MLDFPNSPTAGQLFVGTNGITYMWTGVIWVATSGGTSSGGDFCATHSTSLALGGTAATIIWNSVLSGNANGFYSVSTGRYTPPAGRFYIAAEISGYLSTGPTNIICDIRKNGAVIASGLDSTWTANNWSNPTASIVVDTNGTDWFDVQGTASAGSTGSNGRFLAFPTSGIKGPPGDAGGGGSAFDAILTGNVSIPAISTVSLTGFTETYDNENTFNPATGIWTPTTAGVYRISAFTSVDSSTAAATVRLHMSSTATGGSIGSCQNVAAGASFTASMATSVVRRVTAGTNYYLQVVAASPVNCTCLGSPYTGFNATFEGP